MKASRIREFERLHRAAHEAGMAAGQAAQPVPMVVGSPSSPLGNDVDPRQRMYYVADGVCGFAWIHLDGREPFARFAKEAGLGHKGYPKGFDVSCHEFGQSMQRKEAYCGAYARILKEHGVEAYVQSRMD